MKVHIVWPNQDSGSGCKTVRRRPGAKTEKYLITGQKMWITDGETPAVDLWCSPRSTTIRTLDRVYCGKIVRRYHHEWGGKKKMGIKDRLPADLLQWLSVPVENMLSERENGFKIAVNILKNIGRIKLGIATIGVKSHTEQSHQLCKRA